MKKMSADSMKAVNGGKRVYIIACVGDHGTGGNFYFRSEAKWYAEYMAGLHLDDFPECYGKTRHIGWMTY